MSEGKSNSKSNTEKKVSKTKSSSACVKKSESSNIFAKEDFNIIFILYLFKKNDKFLYIILLNKDLNGKSFHIVPNPF